MRGILEGFHELRDIHIQKFSVNEQETFCVSQAWKIRKIVRFDFGQTRRPNLGHARGLVEGEPASEARFLEFLSEAFDRHSVGAGSDGGVKIDKYLARLRAFAGTQNTALLENINDARGPCVTESQATLEQ